MKLAIITLILGFCYCGSYATPNRFACTQYLDDVNRFHPPHHDQDLLEHPGIFVTKREVSKGEGYESGLSNTGTRRPYLPNNEFNHLLENPDIFVTKKTGSAKRYVVGKYNTEGTRPYLPNNGLNHLVEYPEIFISQKKLYRLGENNTGITRNGKSDYEFDRLVGNPGILESEKEAYPLRLESRNVVGARPGRASDNEFDRNIARVYEGAAGDPEYTGFIYHDYEY